MFNEPETEINLNLMYFFFGVVVIDIVNFDLHFKTFLHNINIFSSQIIYEHCSQTYTYIYIYRHYWNLLGNDQLNIYYYQHRIDKLLDYE